jgi:tetratricopeptide (TPR) repeat protein
VVEPDAPDLINNLAAVYDAQGRQDEAIALIEQIHTRFPDYLFGRTGLAQVSIQRGELERAKELLVPLHQLKHMHTSEFDAYCAAHVELSLAEKNTSVARAWFGMWESANPENMKLERYRHRVIED